MSEKSRDAYESWKHADAQAQAVEAQIKTAWDGYFNGNGSPPSEELILSITRLRAEADAKLTMVRMKLRPASKT